MPRGDSHHSIDQLEVSLIVDSSLSCCVASIYIHLQHFPSAYIAQIIEAKTKETHLVMWEPVKANHQNFTNPAGRPCSSCTIVAGWHSQLYQSANLLHTTKIQHVYSAAIQTQQGNIRAELHPKIKGTSQSAGSLKLDRDNTQPQPILSHYNPDYKIRCLLVSVTKQVP